METRVVNPQTQCRLLQLPPELRNEIWTLVMQCPRNNAEQFQQALLTTRHNAQRPSVLSLLLTCRFIQDEAYGIFYSCQFIEVSLQKEHWARGGLKHLSKTIGPDRSVAIERLIITVDRAMEITMIFKHLRCLPRVKLAMIELRVCECPRSFARYIVSLQMREGYFIRRACAGLPQSLRHLGISLRRTHPWMRPVAYWEYMMMYEHLVQYVRNPKWWEATWRKQECWCLWCDPYIGTVGDGARLDG